MGNIKIIKGVFDTKLELECPIEDVWGIGRRYAAKLQSLGCKTALDFAKHHKDWVRQTFKHQHRAYMAGTERRGCRTE